MGFLLISIFTIVLIGCSENSKQLTRIDVQEVKTDGSYDEVVMITDKDKVESIETIFKQVKWDKNTMPSMARMEDMKATFFYEIDENMPEKLIEYQIWFNQENGTATIISSDKEESYGNLNKKNGKILKDKLQQYVD